MGDRDDELATITADSPLNDITVGDGLNGFEVFVVGGAVRDELRDSDQSPDDIDLMAVARPDGGIEDAEAELEGREGLHTVDPEDAFPVFLDSKGREVALPRTEENTGAGYKESAVTTVPSDTPVGEAVEIDLERRDLRYNALAYNPRSGKLHDPHGGREDLRDGRVRHVSEAFAEDPIRVLRMARFAARFDHEVDEETQVLARDVAPDLDNVPGERICMEMEKAFKQAEEPRRFFDEIREVDALRVALPEIAALANGDNGTGCNIDIYDQTMQTLSTVHRENPNSRGGMFASLGRFMGFSRSVTDEESSIGAKTDTGERTIHGFAGRLGLDSDAERTMLAAYRLNDDIVELGGDEVDAREVVPLIERLDGDRTGLYSPEVALNVAADENDFDRERAQHRIRCGREAIATVEGETVFRDENLSPADIGPGGTLTGNEFGNLVESYRVKEYEKQIE